MLNNLKQKLRTVGDWVYATPRGSEYWLLPFILIAWDQLYSIIVTSALFTYTDHLSSKMADTEVAEVIYVASWDYPFELIVSATMEELAFRIIPIVLLLRYTKSRALMFIAVIVSSVLFSYIHGGPIQLVLQGVGGVVYCVLFIKYSENGTRLWQASALVILMHIIFNALATLISVAGGATTF